MGKAVVDCRRRCDWIEELVYVCSLMCVRVVQRPIHRNSDERVWPRLGEMGRGNGWVGTGTRKGRGKGDTSADFKLDYGLRSHSYRADRGHIVGATTQRGLNVLHRLTHYGIEMLEVWTHRALPLQ
jgi:hypothetical protein